MNSEAERQRWLLAALAQSEGAEPGAWMHPDLPAASGLAAYRRNANATAERALAAAYPTVQQLLGNAAFAALARSAWLRCPPSAGDLGLWHGGLPEWIAESALLRTEPYLSDVARLDWAVHRAGFAADSAVSGDSGLASLASVDPHQLRLRLAAGTALVASAYPVASIWSAHRRSDAGRFDAVRHALAAGARETALVERCGLRVQVRALDAATARFAAAVLAHQSLARALELAGEGFDFAAWLVGAVQERQLWAVVVDSAASATSA